MSPSSTKSRWSVLVCASTINLAQDYFQDLPSSLSRRLKGSSDGCATNGGDDDNCLNLSSTEYNALSAAFTWCSAVAAITVAVVIGQYGIKWSVWTASLLMFSGGLLFAGAIYAETAVAFPLLVLSRCIFGLGNGAAAVIGTHIVNLYWNNSVLAASCYIVWSRVGGTLVFSIHLGIADAVGIVGCAWVAFAFVCVGSIAGMILGRVDEENWETDDDKSNLGIRGLWKFFRRVDGLFWSAATLYFLVHGTVSTFTTNGSTLLGMRQSYSEMFAGFVIGLVPTVSLLIPVVGYVVDKTGRRDYWMTSGAVFILIGLALYIAIDNLHAAALAVLIGVGYAIFDPVASGSSNIISPRNTAGFANGILKFFRYLMVGALAIGAGYILDNQEEEESARTVWKEFIWLELGLIIAAVAPGLLTIFFNWRSKKHPLTKTQDENKRKAEKEEQQKADGEEEDEDEVSELTPLNSDFGKYSELTTW